MSSKKKKNLSNRTAFSRSICASYMYLHEQIHLHTSKRGPETLQQALRDRNPHIHLAAEPSLCSTDEWVGPQQGPPVLSWSPPVLAASDSLQSSTTSQPPHCKQTEYVERILTAASKAPAYVWQQFINILFYCVCWSNHRHRCGGPHWQEIDTGFIFHILTKCVCCCILCSHWHAWRKNIVSLKPPLFSWATCKAKANIRFSVMTNAGFISTSFWLRDLSKQSSPNGLQSVIMTLCQRLENYWWKL